MAAATRAEYGSMLELDTPHGPARAHLHPVDSPAGLLVLGHGAGGGVGSPDLVGATDAANEAGLGVALVEQPYRVAGTAVLCFAFPLHPPGKPEKSRLEELDAVQVPTLVVQGERDPFGLPPPG